MLTTLFPLNPPDAVWCREREWILSKTVLCINSASSWHHTSLQAQANVVPLPPIVPLFRLILSHLQCTVFYPCRVVINWLVDTWPIWISDPSSAHVSFDTNFDFSTCCAALVHHIVVEAMPQISVPPATVVTDSTHCYTQLCPPLPLEQSTNRYIFVPVPIYRSTTPNQVVQMSRDSNWNHNLVRDFHCLDFAKGRCLRGITCRYSHDLAATPPPHAEPVHAQVYLDAKEEWARGLPPVQLKIAPKQIYCPPPLLHQYASNHANHIWTSSRTYAPRASSSICYHYYDKQYCNYPNCRFQHIHRPGLIHLKQHQINTSQQTPPLQDATNTATKYHVLTNPTSTVFHLPPQFEDDRHGWF